MKQPKSNTEQGVATPCSEKVKTDAFVEGRKFSVVNRVIILVVLTLASWGIVFASLYGARKIIEKIF
jgi:hypothetical protein